MRVSQSPPQPDPKGGVDIYKRLLSYLRPHIAVFSLSIFGFLLFALSQPLNAQLLEFMIIELEAASQDARYTIPLMLVGIFLLRGVGTFMGTYFMARVAFGVVNTLRQNMFNHLTVLPNRYFDQHSSGNLISRITYNTTQVTDAVTNALKVIFQEGATVIALLGYLIWKEWKFTLIFLAIVPMLGLVVAVVSRRLRKLSRRIQGSMGDVTSASSEMINNYRVMRTFGGEDYERERFAQASNRNYKQNLKLILTTAASTPVIQLIVVSALAVLMGLLLTYSTLEGAAELVAYLTAAALLPGPIRRLAEVNNKIQKGIAAAESIFEQLDEEVEKDTGDKRIERLQGRIEFRDVEFQYQTSEGPVLDKVSFTVEPGQTVALVGRSGSGKTSLVSLLPRFYDHQGGDILLDGNAIGDIELGSLRSQIALVNQNIDLFNDTVAANIAYGEMAGASREDVQQAADMAYASEFIESLPEGFDSIVGEDGARLSGGQRQRLAIARALLKDAPILILDEATSALDNESEKAIQQALEKVMEGRTTLVVAHRLSTIESADVIVVMDQGRVIEQGSHSELLELGGTYASLHAQNFDDEAEV